MEEATLLANGSGLMHLPEELIIHVIECLDSEPPSITCNSRPPRIEELFRSDTPLKRFSVVSRQFRRILKPILFRHLRICVDAELDFLEPTDASDDEAPSPEDESSSGFLSRLAQRHHLVGSVASVTLYQRDLTFEVRKCTGRKPSHLHVLDWSAFLADVNPARLSVIAPPQTLALLLQRDLWMDDAWAFKISLQRIDLVRNPSTTKRLATIDYPLFRDSNSFGSSPLEVSEHRQWDRFHYHGGSCLPSFGTYHYFLKVPPCLITANDKLTSLYELGRNLAHFSYATMFPHYHHFHKVLRNIAYTMPSLETLTLQLAPSPASDVWCNLELIGRGNLNLRDCWAEIERSYTTLVELLDILAISNQPVFEKLVSVTILDCQIKTLEAELSAMIAEKTSRWVKEDEVTLHRRCLV